MIIGRKTMLFYAIICLWALASCNSKPDVTIVTPPDSHERIDYGVKKLTGQLRKAGYRVRTEDASNLKEGRPAIFVGIRKNEFINSIAEEENIQLEEQPGEEGFIVKGSEQRFVISGSDPSGALYGCLEVADRIEKNSKLPQTINKSDNPEMVMRGACLGLQKQSYLPGRRVYEYPITPENFPWFYDKELWIEYLDMLAENRMNSLYLWNGHPFASLVKLKDYPYAVEVSDSTFKKNQEMYSFLTREANKRGIWVIQMFYNIIVSKPFAEHHDIKTQDRSRPIKPFIADYTQKSITEFVEKYPNVGLLVCLGEAMNTIDDDVQWFTETIIPGVRNGLDSLGIDKEPPIIIRAHDTDAQRVMNAALPIYKNLYTTHKYNGESLTTYNPRGHWTQIHKDLSDLGSVHISNVHILANLEPFRYGSPDFIQKSVKAMRNIHGANGLHLFPQTSYWDWPYTADKTDPRLLQIDRDWIWYETWARYAWEVDRPRDQEIKYWSGQLGDMYGCDDCGREILKAYEETGEIAPKLLRKFGITEGNRQTLLLGMFMSQLVNPHKWHVYPDFYESVGPKGEILIEYAEKEWKGEEHVGETPPQLIQEAVEHGAEAVEAIDKAAPHVTEEKAEFERLQNDVHCYNKFANHFNEKVKAAMHVLRYKYSENIADLEKAVPHLEKSIEYYSQLVDRTEDAYLYANSMQTKQRRIPIGGDDGKYKTWKEMLPLYEEELANFKKNIRFLKKQDTSNVTMANPEPWKPAKVNILNEGMKQYSLQEGTKVYSDTSFVLKEFAPELKNLSGVRMSWKQQQKGTTLKFNSESPVRILVGYFRSSEERIFASPPTLETNAAANDRGQAEVQLANALDIEGLPPVNLHAYQFEAGEHELDLGEGAAIVAGFIKASQDIKSRDAGLGIEGEKKIDWLFY